MPWPLGFLDVTEAGLQVSSWHWSWWVRDTFLDRDSIRSLQLSRMMGVVAVRTQSQDGLTIRVQAMTRKRVRGREKGRSQGITAITRWAGQGWKLIERKQ